MDFGSSVYDAMEYSIQPSGGPRSVNNNILSFGVLRGSLAPRQAVCSCAPQWVDAKGALGLGADVPAETRSQSLGL